MIHIKIFGKHNCDACNSTKQKFKIFLEKWDKTKEVKIDFYDLDTAEGLTEGTMTDATDIPSTIILKDEIEVRRWNGEVPLSKEFKDIFF
ncbi:MAG: hypothetical protein GY817_08705 [bacterium]|nr:hypothetical protein [bacterium]